MKRILTMLTLSILFALPASASRLSADETRDWRTRIAHQCEANFKAKHNNKAAVCDCVGRNFTGLAGKESTRKGALELLTYVEKYYGLKLTQKEIDKDPFYLDEYFQDVGNGCLRDAGYSAPRTK